MADNLLDDDFFNEVIQTKVPLSSGGRRWEVAEAHPKWTQKFIDFMDKITAKAGQSDKHGRRFDIPIEKLNEVLHKCGFPDNMISVGSDVASNDIAGLNNSLIILGYTNKKLGVRRHTNYKTAKYYMDYVESAGK